MSVAQSLQQLEQLIITNIDGLKHIIGSGRGDESILTPQSSRFGMPNLKTVCIDNCSMLESLFPICCTEGLVHLEEVRIKNVPKLHTIFPVEFNLQNLKTLRICNCMLGEVLLSMSVAQSLQQLEYLIIMGTDGLKHIIGSGRGDGSNTSRESILTPQNSRFGMPNLKTVCISDCSMLESLFPICCVEGLVHLKIKNVPKLHIIFPVECNLQNLKTLRICNCMLDEVLFSTSVAQSLQQLEHLVIEGIDGLKHIIGNGRGDGSNTSKEFIPPLMPNLKMIQISACNELESLLPICCVEGLTQLQMLEIIDVPKLRYVLGECDHMDHSSLQYGNQVFLPCLESLIFYGLENLVDMCPKHYQAKWPPLTEMIVEDCPNFATTSDNMKSKSIVSSPVGECVRWT
ncbi:hypothetical protein VNO77_42891 [Canavalia gladiata]|uniref:Disease resistance protein At4g27190-like leucine-rich repeats domain-containing protein n=1 Tax=Canavalia gladiata TaxID=3824 RepID=A0AAN9JVD0_CANGL